MAKLQATAVRLKITILACFAELTDRIRRYFDGEPVDFADKLDLAGTTRFQQNVWRTVRNIPRGETRSYGWVANQLGLPKSSQGCRTGFG